MTTRPNLARQGRAALFPRLTYVGHQVWAAHLEQRAGWCFAAVRDCVKCDGGVGDLCRDCRELNRRAAEYQARAARHREAM
jgi:hypothetical protein